MREIRKLRVQLTNQINLVVPSAALGVDPRLAPPSEPQCRLLRQVLLAGLPDHVARRVDPQEINNPEERTKWKGAYRSVRWRGREWGGGGTCQERKGDYMVTIVGFGRSHSPVKNNTMASMCCVFVSSPERLAICENCSWVAVDRQMTITGRWAEPVLNRSLHLKTA